MHQLNIDQHPTVLFSTNLSTAPSSHKNALENRVIRQLIEALLFEKIIAFTYQNGYFCFRLGITQYRTMGKMSGFSRVRLNTEHMYYLSISNTTKQSVTDEAETISNWQPIELHQILADLPTAENVKQRLNNELHQTIKLCRWNEQFLTRLDSRRELSYHQLESAIDEGHPYHPCFKARTGFSEQDHQHYGPECANTFQLHWLAVRRCYLKRRFNSVPEKTFWQQELDANSLAFLNKKLALHTTDSSAFSFMPIHPWQWLNLQKKLAPAIAKQQLYYLGAAGDSYQASISVRTLLNVSDPNKANIKLPLNIVNTSSLRTIESHSICTAPVLSHWLNQLYKSDTFLQQHMILLPEYAGIRITNDGQQPQPWIDELEDQLGVIFRESLTNYCDDKGALPFVALTAIEQDNKPFIAPWIQEYGCDQWLQKLIETTIIPVWHLLVHHGIALEAHGQNMLLQHQQGWPEKVILRDFHESLEYVHDYLARPELAPIFGELESCYNHASPNQYYWMSSVEALRELLVDTLFVFNLADLAVLLNHYYQYAEQDFWRVVYQCMQDYQQSGITSQERLEKIDIFQPKIKTESLLKKKFDGNRAAEYHHSVNNPLAFIQHNVQSSVTQNTRHQDQVIAKKPQPSPQKNAAPLERNSCLQ